MFDVCLGCLSHRLFNDSIGQLYCGWLETIIEIVHHALGVGFR
jgi:hypothetical protein